MNAPSRRLRLGAALFNGDHGHLADEIARLEAAGLDAVHLDVFDGHFVPDLGFAPRTIAALRPLTPLPFEVHLAARDPLRFVPDLAAAGADLVLIHLEAMQTPYETLFSAKEHVRAGLALTLGASLDRLAPLLPMVDAVLLLSRVTGEGAHGAAFNPLALPRARAVQAMAAAIDIELDLQVAGGVNRRHVVDLVEAGATTLALGAGLYRVEDMAAEVVAIRAAAGA